MFGLGSQELLVILVIVLVLFGANRLPQIARSLGSSLKEFKKGVEEAKAEDPRVVPPRDDRAAPPSVARSCGHCASALAPCRLTASLGRIDRSLIVNGHDFHFEHWARMWRIDDRVTELRPDPEASRRAWERYDALW